LVEDFALVTVRNSSSRLPNKAIMRVKGEIKSIDIVLQRAKKTGFPVILVTSTAKSDDVFEKIAHQNHVEIFRGALLNKIKRWFDCFYKFDIENALLVDGDDLSYNYDIGKRAINELKSKKLDLIANPKDIVTGFFTYAINRNGISKLYDTAKSEIINTDVITRFLEKAKLKSDLVTLKDFERNENLRFTLDYKEDLEFFQKLYQEIDILDSGEKIVNFINKNKNLVKINFHRQKEFLDNQAKFNASVK